MIRSETGGYPLKLKVDAKEVGCIKYINEKTDDHLSKVAYKYEKQMAETCNRPNLHSFLLEINNKVGNNIVHQTKRKINKLLESYYYSVWKDRLNQTNKSLTFRLYKENVTIAPYLLHVKNRKHKRAMSKLRLSDHNLEVEVGRDTKPKTNCKNRICKLCTYPNIEDEVHFIEMQKSEIQMVSVGKKTKTNKF